MKRLSWRRLCRVARDHSGQALSEYVLLVAAVAGIALSAMLLFGPIVASTVSSVGGYVSTLAAALGGAPPAGEPDAGPGGRGRSGWGAPSGPGRSPASGDNPGIGHNPGNANSAPGGSNPGRGRGLQRP